MAIFDGRLIAPTEKELVSALRKAQTAANRENRHYTNRMTRDAAFWGRFAQDVLRSGPEGRRRSCKGGRSVPDVVAGWWTDPAGRKHIRVIGRTRWGGYNPFLSGWRRETDMRALPPWWHVYPEAVLGIRGKKDNERYLAVCRCGAIGTPESLGWMGDTCGPCFDRRVEGGTTAGGYGQFRGWSTTITRFCFSADGQHLVGQNHAGNFWKVNREDGSALVGKKKTYHYIVGTVANAEGNILVMQDGNIYRWRTGANDIEVLLTSRRVFWGRAALAPDGSRIVFIDYQHAHTADLTAAKPRYTPFEGIEAYSAIRYMPDGSRLLVMTYAGELRYLNPETMASEVARGDAFNGLPSGYGPPMEMAMTRDGSAVLVRRDRHYPGGSSVRHIPLSAGKVIELRLPPEHRPTAVAYSPDGQYAVTVEAESGWVGFFETASGKLLGFVRGVMEGVGWRTGQIEFSPDGRALAVSYSAGNTQQGSTVAVWPWPEVLQAAELGAN